MQKIERKNLFYSIKKNTIPTGKESDIKLSASSVGLDQKSRTPVLIKSLRISLTALSLAESGTLRKELPPLVSLIGLLERPDLSAGSGDLKLMSLFIEKWLGRYGCKLPPKHRREISELGNLLGNTSSFQSGQSDNEHCYTFASGDENKKIKWSVEKKRRNGSDEKGGKKAVSCSFEFESDKTGLIKAKLESPENDKYICHLFASRRKTRNAIAKSLSDFSGKVRNRGLNLVSLGVFPWKRIIGPEKIAASGEIDLWG